MTENVIFYTVHGSNLYGLAHKSSDMDLFIVTSNTGERYAKHYVENGVDVCEMSLGVFLDRVYSGSHQAVEALFSQGKVWVDERYKPMLDSVKVTGPIVEQKYRRTIRKFCFGDFKRRRHAMRLALNLHQIHEVGRFNPTLTAEQVLAINVVAETLEGENLWEVLGFEELSAKEKHPSYGLV